MFTGRPVLYIGPSPSHITDILNELEGNIAVAHGQVELLVEKLLHFKQLGEEAIAAIGNQNRAKADRDFNPEKLKSEMVKWLVAEEGNGAAD
jgi:hypothetical protein